MGISVRGMINGRHIELERDPELPSGTTILVHIEPYALEEKRQLVDELCGAWADDPSIPQIFSEIERARRLTAHRDVEFNGSP